MSFKKLIVLSPHPDDAEFSSGGTLNKFINEGSEVYNLIFSPCNKSLPEHLEKNHLFIEADNAGAKIRIKKENIIKYNFPVREFPSYRQDILEELIKVKKTLNPDLVLMPNSNDVHQDHHVIYEEGLRAFKTTRILGYELPWNNIKTTHNYFVELSNENLEAKLAAIAEYKSQNFRGYKKNDYFLYLAKIRGLQMNVPLAEAFELIKWIY